MAKILKFRGKTRMNLFLEIQNRIKNYKEKKFQNHLKKVLFLYNQAYSFFCDYHKGRIGDCVDLPYFEYATKDAVSAIARIIANKRVNQCFESRVAELKRMGRKSELKGVVNC